MGLLGVGDAELLAVWTQEEAVGGGHAQELHSVGGRLHDARLTAEVHTTAEGLHCPIDQRPFAYITEHGDFFTIGLDRGQDPNQMKQLRSSCIG